ncbi:sorting nexin-22 isoform X1 [Sorex araneus]|uniref:sorting nexin-22 isoform X1 n=1 Tax=Sorex araneus TaxID=42254 RepID=UPI00243355B0|nr:sorting nexin-22 isoform X1 [Sorex araneus]
MLLVHILSAGPEAAGSRQSPDKGHLVFRVQVRCGGRRHTLLRRYSDFHALHRRIKKLYQVPDFPSKRLPGWRSRGLEQQRLGLEAYVQGILYLNREVPKELLQFLGLLQSPADPETSSWGAQPCHPPVLGFGLDPYVRGPTPEPLPSVVVRGVLQGLYDSLPDSQPEARGH